MRATVLTSCRKAAIRYSKTRLRRGPAVVTRDGGLGGTEAPEDGAWGARTTRASVLWLTAASYSRLVNDLLASSHDFSALLSAMTQGQNVWEPKETKGKTKCSHLYLLATVTLIKCQIWLYTRYRELPHINHILIINQQNATQKMSFSIFWSYTTQHE